MVRHGAEVANREPRVVTVWSDVGCPWASLALETLHSARRRSPTDILIDHRAFPLERFNGRLTPKSILDAEVVAIAGLRPELGWRARAVPESTYPVTMLPAMKAVQAAKAEEVGGLAASDELDRALRRAFYCDSACINIHVVVLDR